VLVSVIIPNYNHEAYLAQRIESVLNQTYPDFEVILLDDCSTDNSREILQHYRNHHKVSHILFNEANSGSPFKQWVKGVALAKGEFIWLAESDDYAAPTFLEETMNSFEENPTLDVVFVGTTNVDENNQPIPRLTRIQKYKQQLLRRNFVKSGKDFLEDFMPDFCVIRNMSCAVVKKHVFTSLAWKATSFKTIGDFYFWVVLCLENRNFAYLSQPLNYMRSHSGNVRQSEQKKSFKEREYQRIHQLVIGKRWYQLKLVVMLFKHYIKRYLR
jgi:glycosyltransferase involved in cell wall biosynthesis